MGFSLQCTSRGNLPHMRRHPMQLYSSKSPQQPTEPQETLYLCILSLKCLCRFLSVSGFSFLPLSFLVWLRFQLICRTKMLAKSDPANIHSSSFLCRFIVFIHNYLKTIFYNFFFILIFYLGLSTIYIAQGCRNK